MGGRRPNVEGVPVSNGQVGAAPDEPTLPSALVQAVAGAVSVFGATVTPKLAAGVGEPEDQMRGALETLLDTVAAAVGVTFTVVGEASLSDLKVRPDYAAFVNGAISGYVEVKASGKGADPTRWKPTSHDGVQWSKLSALPNVLYTDGESWGLYRTGERVGEVVHLVGDVSSAGAGLTTTGDSLARMLHSFLSWTPVPPRNIGQLVQTVAPLTRLLRDEVVDTLARESADGAGPFTNLASDWRALLFPEASDFEFADGYAQSVTFALLLARTENIAFDGKTVDAIAKELGKSHSLLGKALAVLTDETIGALAVTLDTLVRVVSVVDFGKFPTHVAEPYLALYEKFLETYDPALRQASGSYYTPTPVVAAMTRLADQVLQTRLDRPLGLASDQVTILDSAMGTGTFVLDVIETVAETVRKLEGPGAVPSRVTDLATRLIGIEKQSGPYAVAELRVAEALKRHGAATPKGGVRLYVADSLEDPWAVETKLGAGLEPIAVSRRNANKMKQTEPVVVVIGNPPYLENAKGKGGFVETGSKGIAEWATAPMKDFREPGNGLNEYVLNNLYVFFWRMACWKVFDAHPENSNGVVCFITTSGYLKGVGFAGMRRYLRENAFEGWIIDCTPEGLQPEVATRLFSGVQQPLAIGIFAKRADKDKAEPGRIRYRAIHGRQGEKFDQLKGLDLDGDGWEDCPDGWTAPFLPAGGEDWETSPALGDLLPWQAPGVKPNRTWIYAPSPATLKERWRQLIAATGPVKPAMFRETDSSSLGRAKPGLFGFPHSPKTVAEEKGDCLEPVPVAYRSFDVQYVIPDDRVMHRPSPELWRVRGEHQIYITEQHAQPLKAGGPALTFAAHTPDMDHYKGSAGGRVLPLYASPDKALPNLAPGLLPVLEARLGHPVAPEDVVAYIAAVTAHPAFITTFAEDLRTPGVRVPLTADPAVWADAVTVGRRVLWLHSRAARYADPADGRPTGPPRVGDPERTPMVQVAIPAGEGQLPDDLAYDPATQTLSIGDGRIAPVSAAVARYEVSGTNVLRKWFGYRRATRPKTGGVQSPLDDVRPTAWPSAYTTDLLELLHVLTLVTDLEPAQAKLLERVMAGPRVTVGDLKDAGVFPVPAKARDPLGKAGQAETLPLG